VLVVLLAVVVVVAGAVMMGGRGCCEKTLMSLPPFPPSLARILPSPFTCCWNSDADALILSLALLLLLLLATPLLLPRGRSPVSSCRSTMMIDPRRVVLCC